MASEANIPQSDHGNSHPLSQDRLVRVNKKPSSAISFDKNAAHLLYLAHQSVSREDFHEANRLFHQAADRAGGNELWRWKSLGFCPTTFSDENAIDRYWGRLHEGLDLAISANIPIDWRSLPTDGFCPSFNLPHLGKCCKEIREKFCNLFVKAFPHRRPEIKRRSSGRLRLGFHALHGHEGGFVRGSGGIIEQLDLKRFEVFVFAPDLGIEQCKQSIKSDNVTYVSLGGTFETVVKKVRDTECDLIYYRKAGSDPWSYFFPFAQCAPVQVTSYGTHGTSGIAAMDYFLSSSDVEPENGQDYYTERLFSLNAMPTYQTRLEPLESPASRDAFNLPKAGAIYFCPHRTAKYHPSFDFILESILERDPTGHVVVLTGRDSRGRDVLMNRLRHSLGEPLLKRMTFIPALSFQQYKSLLSLATCMLDSPLYAGGLTSFDSFSYAIPEVTISGPLHVQNFATGIYRKMGLGHLPCRDIEEYIEFAVRLGTEPEYRKEISDTIRMSSDRIFGSREIIEEHERFFETACLEYGKTSPSLHRQADKSLQHWQHLAHCPEVFESEDEIDAYRDRLHTDLDRALDAEPRADWRRITTDGFCPSFHLPHLGRCCREIKEKFAKLFAPSFERWEPLPSESARLRIGFVVAAGHHVGFLYSMSDIVKRLDLRRFEPIIFCERNAADSMRHSMTGSDVKIISLPLPFDQAAETIRVARCDIVYHWKIGGNVRDYFLPFARCAPVQCTSWGTHGTSGVATVDWYLGATAMESGADADTHYTERLYRASMYPGFFKRVVAQGPLSRDEFGLPPHGSLYFCPHRLSKLQPCFDDYLKRLLESDPTGHIIFLDKKQTPPFQKFQNRLKSKLDSQASARLLVVPFQPQVKLYRLYALVDAVLDSPVYSGGLTAYDALALGTPTVTQRGRLSVQHQAAGLYDMIGMHDFPVADIDTYVALAARLGSDPDYQQTVRRRITDSSEMLFANDRIVGDFELFWETIRKHHPAG